MEIHHLEKSGFRLLNLVDCPTPDGDCNAGGDLWGHAYPLQKLFQQFTALSDEEKEVEVMSHGFIGQMLAQPSIVLLIDKFIASYGDKELATSRKKNASASDEYRTRGNRHFSNGLRSQAAYYYTMSIVYAPNVARDIDDDQEVGTALSLAYGNRSAAFFGLGKYEACLTDIEHALATGYPPAKYAKLYLRKVECLMSLSRYREAKDALSAMVKGNSCPMTGQDTCARIQKITARLDRTEDGQSSASAASSSPATNQMLSIINYLSRTGRYEPSTKLPPLSTKLEPRTTKKVNCLVAKQDIKPGEILMVESPFVSVLARKYEFHFCHHCVRRLDMKGPEGAEIYIAGLSVPCTHCTRVLYCSTDCRTESWRLYHQFECAILPVLYEMTTFGHLALRMLLVTGLDVASRVFARNVNANEEGEQQVRMPDFCDPTNVEANYETVCRLTLPERDNPPPEWALFQLASAVMVRALMKSQSQFVRTHEEAMQVGTILQRHFVQAYVSSHKISSRISEAELSTVAVQVGESAFTIGRGMYPYLASTWKHSCDPNTKHTYVNGTVALYRATRHIPAGTEVTISLGTTFIEHEWKERQAALCKQYGFKCDCAKCVLEGRDGLNGKYFPIGCKNCGCTLTRTSPTSTTFNCSSPSCTTIMSLSTVAKLYAKAESHLAFLNQLCVPGRINTNVVSMDRLAEAERHLAQLSNMKGMANYCKLSLLNYHLGCIFVANGQLPVKHLQYYDRYVEIAEHNSGMCDAVYLLVINQIEFYKTFVGDGTGNLDWYARPMQRAVPLARLFALANAQDESTAPDVLVEDSRYSWKVENFFVARLNAIALRSEEIN